MFSLLILFSTLVATEVLATAISKDGPSIPCAFDTYDSNGDDVITRQEFLQATSGLPQSTSLSIFIRMDSDHDGSIQRTEFKHRNANLMRGIFDHCRSKCGWWGSDCSGCHNC
ncbi:uncharacterized protein LOC144622363 [Crassostrea virginica]